MCRRIAEEDLIPETHPFEIDAPDIAGKAQAAQFVVVRVDETEKCMPLTVAGWDRDKGTVTVVFVEAGRTPAGLAIYKAGDSLANSSGSFSMPTLIGRPGATVRVASEFAIASIAPIARATEQAHNKVIPSMGLRTRDFVFGEDSLRSVSDEPTATAADADGRGEWSHRHPRSFSAARVKRAAVTGTNAAVVRVSKIPELNVCAVMIDEVAVANAAA